MRLPDLVRSLTPLGWSLAVAAAATAVLTLGHGLGLRWDPFDLATRRLVAAEARAVTAESDAVARRLEVEGAADQGRRVDRHHQQAVSVAVATDRAETEARIAHDALDPLDPARTARLREHDRRLCELSPAVCIAAPSEAARGGGDAMPTGPVA